jgi:hypothetical protein
LNRNWGAHFQKPIRPNPCSENYGGVEAFEAVELQGIRDLLLNATDPFHGFLDLHSFGQMIMSGLASFVNNRLIEPPADRFPFAYDCEKTTLPDYENLYEAVIGASKAAKSAHGRPFQAGQICDISYAAGGDSADWTYLNANVTWSFSCELRDLGTHGFLLPEREIRPSGEEALNALLSLTEFIILVRPLVEAFLVSLLFAEGGAETQGARAIIQRMQECYQSFKLLHRAATR